MPVRDATDLSCSIGVRRNKLLGRSRPISRKPDGLVLVDHDDVPIASGRSREEDQRDRTEGRARLATMAQTIGS